MLAYFEELSFALINGPFLTGLFEGGTMETIRNALNTILKWCQLYREENLSGIILESQLQNGVRIQLLNEGVNYFKGHPGDQSMDQSIDQTAW